MKSLYTLLSLLISLSIFGQKQAASGKALHNMSPSALRSDSLVILYPGNWLDATDFLLYTTPGEGYVNGTNEYLDKAKAEKFVVLNRKSL